MYPFKSPQGALEIESMNSSYFKANNVVNVVYFT